jgi:hypothetical protein
MKAKLRAGHKGRKCTEEHKRKVSEAKSSPHKIIFDDGREIIVKNIMDFCKQSSYKYSGIYNVKLGYRKFYKDIVEVQKII